MNKSQKGFRPKNDLNCKTGRCPKRKEASAKGLGNLLGIAKSVRSVNGLFFKSKSKKLGWGIVAQSKFANKTVVKIVMTVSDFGFVYSIFVMAVFLRNEFFQMVERVKGLQQDSS